MSPRSGRPRSPWRRTSRARSSAIPRSSDASWSGTSSRPCAGSRVPGRSSRWVPGPSSRPVRATSSPSSRNAPHPGSERSRSVRRRPHVRSPRPFDRLSSVGAAIEERWGGQRMTAGHTTIAGVGSMLPDRVVPNEWFASFLNTSDEWIVDRTGISERRFAPEDVATSDLATEASRRALDSAGLAPEQVDLIVCATLTPDTPIPSTAVWVQRSLGVSCPAFDVNAACAGFSYGLSTGTAFVESGTAETVLVIGAEILSRVLNFRDRSTAVLFGDGAGAVVLRRSERPGVLGGVLGADGRAAEVLVIPGGGTRRPASAETLEAHENTIHMSSGREVFKRAVVAMGNTSAASIPIALDRAWRAGRIGEGDLVLMTSFGAGLAWGANLIRWTIPRPEPA